MRPETPSAPPSTVAITAGERQAGLSDARRQLLDRLRRGDPRARTAEGAIPRRDGASAVPLSYAQERFWFLHHLGADSAAYHVPRCWRLLGPLDVAALEQSIQEVERRHEVLRTRFPEPDGMPVQEVAPPAPRPLPRVDLEGLPGPLRHPEAERLAGEAIRQGFDLRRGPAWRALAVALAADDHALVVVLHHTVADGWSLGLWWREVEACYRALRSGKVPELPALPVQYADFTLWQRAWLPRHEERLLAYWLGQLAGCPHLLDLPADRPRPAVRSSAGRARPFAVAPALARGLSALARQEQSTPFMALAAGLGAMLQRYTGKDDILVGTPVGSRRREVEDLLGPFLNTLVLRLRPFPGSTFRALLRAVRATTLDAHEHQDLPFERLLDRLQLRRDVSHTPLFQVLFVFQNAFGRVARFADLNVAPLPFPVATVMYDLTLTMAGQDGELEGVLAHATRLFDGATAERMIGHFAALLAGAAETPDRTLAELPLLAPAEAWMLAGEWNDTATAPGAGECLHDLFAAQAARTPGAEALVAGRERWTYGELAARSSALAAHLRTLGVGPEDRVAICAGRSAGLVAGLLAVLQAGAAYVPIDPAYPPERQAWILADARAAVLLTERALLARLPAAAAGVRRVLLDEAIPAAPPAARGPAAAPGNLAYLIYTSGSTGRPKGVAIEHRGAAALMRWARQVYADADLAGVLFSTSICFDLSVFELFAPLSWGGRVVLADHALALPDLPARGEVRLVNTVPSALAELLRTGGLPPAVRTVNLAGEALRQSLVEAALATGTVERLWNLYGPSESTTYSTFARAVPGDERDPAIGRPVAGTRAYVVDAGGRLAPVGVAGELLLGGTGLARGYFDRPGLTAERFVPDPWSGLAGARLYRTGDLARTRPGGELEFLGRLDHQVKVRGFRIEPGEVEAALLAHPGLRAAVVLAREDRPGEARLVAYVVGRGEPPAADDLRAHLRRRLPEHLVPSVFVALPELPLSPNGKLDRQALPAPEVRPAAPDAAAAPRTRLERALAGIWCDVLGIAAVGLHDNFFDAGGSSLELMRVYRELRSRCGVEASLVDLLRHPTLLSLARHLDGGRDPRPAPSGPPPEEAGRRLAEGRDRLRHRLQRARGTAP